MTTQTTKHEPMETVELLRLLQMLLQFYVAYDMVGPVRGETLTMELHVLSRLQIQLTGDIQRERGRDLPF